MRDGQLVRVAKQEVLQAWFRARLQVWPTHRWRMRAKLAARRDGIYRAANLFLAAAASRTREACAAIWNPSRSTRAINAITSVDSSSLTSMT